MPALLEPILAWLVKTIIPILIAKLTSAIISYEKMQREKAQAKLDADKSVQPLKDAKSADEINKAIDTSLDKF
jgi:hypothetical protein